MTIILKFINSFLLLLLLSACGKMSLSNPFGASQSSANTPYANATHYVCADKKHFYVRMLENQQQAWLIYPDHEVSLSQSSTDKNRYQSGVISLLINGNETTLNDGEKIAYKTCQAQH